MLDEIESLQNKNSLLEAELKQVQARVEKIEKENTHLKRALSDIELKEKDPTQDRQIEELLKANQQLKIEVSTTQQSVGEVMLIAKEQAKRMIEEAEKKATVTIEVAKQELIDIGVKASQLTKEVVQSQEQVNRVYDDLSEQLTSLTTKEFDY